jgi:hypothetical protein
MGMLDTRLDAASLSALFWIGGGYQRDCDCPSKDPCEDREGEIGVISLSVDTMAGKAEKRPPCRWGEEEL